MNNLVQSLWLAGDRIGRALGQFIVVGAIARSLTVPDFGILSWALAVVTTAGLLSWASVDTALIRWWLEDTDQAPGRLRAVYRSQWVLAGISFAGVLWVSTQHLVGQMVLVFVGLSLAAQSTNILRYWNESKRNSGRYVRWDQAHYWIFLAVKLAAAASSYPLESVAAAFAIEGLTKSVLMARLHRAELKGPRSDRHELGTFAAKLSPLIVAYLCGMAALKLPQLWLESVAGPHETAYYAAAARLVEPLAFVPWALISPLFVQFVTATDVHVRQRLRRKMMQLSLGAGLLMALVLYLFAPYILGLVFGAEYREISTPVLKVLAWTLLPQFALLVLVREGIDSGRTKILALQGLVQLVLLAALLYNAGRSAKGLTAETASTMALVAAVASVLLPIIQRFASMPGTPNRST